MNTGDLAPVSSETRGHTQQQSQPCDLRPDGRPFRGVETYTVLGVRWWRRWVEADMYFRCKACPVNVRVPCAPADRASMIRLMRQNHAAWRAQQNDPAAAAAALAAWNEQTGFSGGRVAYVRGLNERIRPPAWDQVPAIWGVPTPAKTLRMSRRKLRAQQHARRVAALARQSLRGVPRRWEGK